MLIVLKNRNHRGWSGKSPTDGTTSKIIRKSLKILEGFLDFPVTVFFTCFNETVTICLDRVTVMLLTVELLVNMCL